MYACMRVRKKILKLKKKKKDWEFVCVWMQEKINGGVYERKKGAW